LDGLRRKFADGKCQRVEQLIGELLTSGLAISAARKARKIEEERRERERQEAERRRREIERRRLLEQKRVEFLQAQMELFSTAGKIEEFVETYLSVYSRSDMPETCCRFIGWAQARAQALRDAAAPHILAAKLDEHHLMDETAALPTILQQ
jgi:hypothetical protein